MMEVINNVFALIYIRKNVDEDGDVIEDELDEKGNLV